MQPVFGDALQVKLVQGMRPAGAGQAEKLAFGLVPALGAVGAQGLAQARQVLAQAVVDGVLGAQRLIDRQIGRASCRERVLMPV